MRRLTTHVVVHRPAGSVMLPAGAALDDADAALVTNSACWVEDGTGETDAGDVGQDEHTPDETWTIEQIRDWAEKTGIDLGKATKKSDLLLIIGDEIDGDHGSGEGPDDGQDVEGAHHGAHVA